MVNSDRKDGTQSVLKLFFLAVWALLVFTAFYAGLGPLPICRDTDSPSDIYRILCLGDTITAGGYPVFLQEILDERGAGIEFKVIDKGLEGAKSSYILGRTPRFLRKYNPDMVISMMGFHNYEKSPESFFKKAGTVLGRRTHNLIARFVGLMKEKAVLVLKRAADFRRPGKNLRYKFYKNKMPQDPAQAILQRREKVIKNAIVANPENYKALVELGGLYLDMGRYDKAEKMLEKATKINPEYSPAHAEMEKLDLIESQVPESPGFCMEGYRRQIRKGISCREQGRMEEAEAELKKAAQMTCMRPGYDWAEAELAVLYRKQGRFEESEELFRELLSLNQYYYRLYLEQGRLYRDMGRLDEAEELLKQALSLEPGNFEAHKVLSGVYALMGEYAASEEHLRKKAAIRPDALPVSILNHIRLYLMLNEKDITYVCMQYPLSEINALKEWYEYISAEVILVDIENLFSETLKTGEYSEYFRDSFAGDYGHFTEKRNILIAENLANLIIEKVQTRVRKTEDGK